MPIKVTTIREAVAHPGFKIDRTGIKQGSKIQRALVLLTEKPKKPNQKSIYDLTKRGETEIKLAKGSTDTVKISSKQASGDYSETVSDKKFLNPVELKNYMMATIKRFTGNYDRL